MDRTGSGISSEEELGAAVDHIEAALQLAFSGESGARRIALAEAVAADIKAAAPTLDIVALETVMSLARRIAADPSRSLGAQAHLGGGAVRTLTG